MYGHVECHSYGVPIQRHSNSEVRKLFASELACPKTGRVTSPSSELSGLSKQTIKVDRDRAPGRRRQMKWDSLMISGEKFPQMTDPLHPSDQD
jgi:hypothetical protein